MAEEIREGGCNCGAVRFTARGRPRFISNCHCLDCRRATGAPFSTWVGFDSEQVSWKGERAIHHSSPTVSRGYCARCGTPLSYSGKQWSKETHLLVGTFDHQEGLVPTVDSFPEERLPWVQLIKDQ
ncbi:MAG: GFA family protein [Pseudomonadota bacterium]|jgi:hypothetical protein|nr:MAG: hypothetical protein DIU62_00125 [Pseudomonadota bacterium]